MKLKFNCNSGANIHSCRTEVLDTEKDLGLEDGEWESMSDDEKQELVNDWAWQKLEIYWTEVNA